MNGFFKIKKRYKKVKMNNNVFNFKIVNNDHADEVSDEMSCSTCVTDIDLSIVPLSDENNDVGSVQDKGKMTLAELEFDDDDDMLSEVSTVCYDETDHMEWDGSKTLGIGEVCPFNSDDFKEAHRLGMSVCDMFKMYDEINNHVDEDDYKNNCPPEWPLHLDVRGTYEDEGFDESYYG